MDAFAPLPALVGGLLIGLASALLWLGNGRIAGISSLFGDLLPPARDSLWQATFLVSLVLGALFAAWLLPGLGNSPQLVAAPSGWGIPTPWWLALSGLLIGFGTRLGNGCTSGHGVCGLARLSPRSLVAVAVFFGMAMLTVTLTGIV